MVRINSEEFDASGKTLSQYLSEEGFDTSRVAVERNGNIIPRSQYSDTVFKDGDKIEIVCFVGGG